LVGSSLVGFIASFVYLASLLGAVPSPIGGIAFWTTLAMSVMMTMLEIRLLQSLPSRSETAG